MKKLRGNKWHSLPLRDFFWSRVKVEGPDDCWLWYGSCYSAGYGDCRKQYAHRVSFEINSGKKIPSRLQALHTCDNRRCVNPKHLYLGTDKENRRDACNRARYPGGAKSSRAKLTDGQVLKIRHLAKTKHFGLSREETARKLSKIFPVTTYCIRDILAGKRWTHI